MSDTLIALIDGSIYSHSVCENAAWLANRTGKPVELIHVLGRREAPQGDLSGSIALGARSALLAELSELDQKRAKLAQQKGRAILEDGEAILKKQGVSVRSQLKMGDVLETLSGAEDRAEMVVVGKRGEAADFAKLHLGSNLERVVRASSKPVFIAARAFLPIQKVLLAFDGGSSAVKAVEYVAQSPVFEGLAIHLLTVGNESGEAWSKLEHAKGKLERAGRTVTTGVQAGQPEKVIARTIENDGHDLLVMGAYGHSRIRTLLVGSTTTEMVRSCKVPVLLVR